MTTTDRHVVAIGGGGLAFGPGDRALDDYVLSLTGRDNPRIAFLRSLANLELEPSRVGALRAVAEAAITPAARR